jgi:hypothetical protein
MKIVRDEIALLAENFIRHLARDKSKGKEVRILVSYSKGTKTYILKFSSEGMSEPLEVNPDEFKWVKEWATNLEIPIVPVK